MMRLLSIVALASFAYSAEAFICPKSFQNVPIGATEQQVLTLCGEPKSKSQSKNERRSEQREVLIWTYSAKRYYDPRKAGRVQQSPEVSFAFIGNELIAIRSSGVDASSMTMCGRSFTAKQSTKSDVESSCGAPNYTSSQSTSVSKGSGKSSVWIYQFAPYQPQKVFRFFNGKLESIQ